MKNLFKVVAFGRDCYGNISGYKVVRTTGSSAMSEYVVKDFWGNIYVEGSFEKARQEAQELCDKLNNTLKE